MKAVSFILVFIPSSFPRRKNEKENLCCGFFLSIQFFIGVEKTLILRAFFLSLPFLFRRRKGEEGVEDGDIFPSLSSFFLSQHLLFRGKKKRRRTLFPSHFLPLGEDIFLFLFPFFREEGERKTPFLFRFFLLFSSLFWRGKMGENGGRNGKGERKKFCLF